MVISGEKHTIEIIKPEKTYELNQKIIKNFVKV